jgi:hypothetical protein
MVQKIDFVMAGTSAMAEAMQHEREAARYRQLAASHAMSARCMRAQAAYQREAAIVVAHSEAMQK